MERVLMYKANYLADVLGYKVGFVTTEQKGRASFFTFSSKIDFFDLGINYDEDKDKNLVLRFFLKLLKKRKHQRYLHELLVREQPDICVSMFDRDMDFLYKIEDGSKKILEYHFSKNFKLIEATNPIIYFFQKIRIWNWGKIIQKYACFVVLTEEDKKAWGDFHNICVIPNFLTALPKDLAALVSKRVISVGRLENQKGFDYLIKTWSIVCEIYPDWSLCIFGDGDKRKELEHLVSQFGLENSVFLKEPTSDIKNEYLQSSVYAMCSRYEGLPMVLLEAMSYGLPIVSFTCPCGPRDVVKESFGSLVPVGDIDSFAGELMAWMASYEKRCMAGKNARHAAEHYLESEVMMRWERLFRLLAFGES
ncbi:MAG: glycosyltransferase family 4 protein [Odoribacter sp.]